MLLAIHRKLWLVNMSLKYIWNKTAGDAGNAHDLVGTRNVHIWEKYMRTLAGPVGLSYRPWPPTCRLGPGSEWNVSNENLFWQQLAGVGWRIAGNVRPYDGYGFFSTRSVLYFPLDDLMWRSVRIRYARC